ncbi:DNA internalization-related competence protein ComEC/Rec2 [Virgibacillus sp. W0181]|uniref:DNA internalization-related competence protein ComEC/Rec2 n=1 Tax=Virgibacillus sp. W0181 TaxID=3391581 RepID=UPI003F46E9B1
MKGYWHFTAFAVVCSILTVRFQTNWFAVILLLWLFYLYYLKRLRIIPIVLSLIIYLFFSYYIPSIDSTTPTESDASTEQVLTGKIKSSITTSAKRIAFTFKSEQNQKLLAVIFLEQEESSKGINDLKHGATCTIRGELVSPEPATNPGQFDYQTYLKQQGIIQQFIIEEIDHMVCSGSSVLHYVYTVRSALMEHVEEIASPETSVWIKALLFGDRTDLGDYVTELFNRWSLSHLLAISGLHIGIIVALLYFSLVQFNLMTKEKAQWVVLIFLPIYSLLAGSQPSILRASMMVVLVIVLNKVKSRHSLGDIVSIVFLTFILSDKYIVYHIGFQFSFMVTFGLIISRQWIADTDSKLFQLFQISFVSQMIIFPLQVAYFSAFHPLSILLNVLVVPYFTLFVIPYLFFLLFISLFPSFAFYFFESLFIQIHDTFLFALEVVDEAAYYPFMIGKYPFIFGALYMLLFALCMNHLQLKRLKYAFYYGGSVVFLIVWLAVRPYFSPTGIVTMLDIGQGDAYIVELPYRKGVFLIDAGAEFSFTDYKPTKTVYEQIIKAYLHSRGIHKIDAIFLSHEDLDHDGSVSYIVNDMDVKEIFISEFYEMDEDKIQDLQKNNVAVKRVAYNENVTISGQTFYFLSPLKDNESSNENSLIIYTSFEGIDWLFTGDAGKETEQEIITFYDQLTIDVLKVGHHGSNTSTDPSFIKKVKPQAALISVGKNNRYGHPTNEVIQTLEDSNITIFRTDKHGAVQFFYRNNIGTFRTYLP